VINVIKQILKNGLSKYQSSRLRAIIDNALFYSAILIFFAAVYELGFLGGDTDTSALHKAYYAYLFFYFIFFSVKMPSFLKNRGQKIYMTVIRVLMLIMMIFYLFNVNFVFDSVDYHGIVYRFLTSPYLVYLLIFAVFFIEVSKTTFKILVAKIKPEALFALSFFVMVFIGAGLLKLPNAANGKLPFVDCLFMATSATSITGLQCVDSAVGLTTLGQLIILTLLQIGGLGVMTFTCFIAYFFKDTSSFKADEMLGNMVGTQGMGSALKIVLTIVIYTFTIEIFGAAAIYFSIRDSVFNNFTDELKFSVYNSISAFCNAGFTTIPGSMTDAAVFHNYYLKIIIAVLAILGGVGFPVLINLQNFLYRKMVNLKRVIIDHKRYIYEPRLINVNTKLATIVSTSMFCFGTLSFLFFEWGNTLQAHGSFLGKFIDSFYYAVMPRSAGFNDISLSDMRLPTVMLLIFQMWVGASPISTGGGIKTTTFGVAFLVITSILHRKDRIEIFRRKIANSTVRTASAVIMLSLIFIFTGSFLIAVFEEHNDKVSFISIVFETVSAYCTCGLSMGITDSLSSSSKLVLTFLMYVGRVGALTLVAAFFTPVKSLNYMYPKEQVYIG
jgi:Trk-type K+ transport system membrane component